ncbi:MAG: ABC transporter ATP-binding protein [Planctomycetota bacterium]
MTTLATDSAVVVTRLVKTFGNGETKVDALNGIDFTLRRGEFVAVMGPSGSGKSTLLHVLAGLVLPDGGSVSVGGNEFAQLDDDALTLLRRRHLGFVFQAFFLVEVLTAIENVALPLLLDGVAEVTALARARALLERMGLAARAAHLPAQLSGGEKQRVAIARAMVHEPLLLLADEPTGNLDSRTGDDVLRLLRELVDAERLSVLMVTHDVRSASYADRIVRLRDGRVTDEQTIRGSGAPSATSRELEA